MVWEGGTARLLPIPISQSSVRVDGYESEPGRVQVSPCAHGLLLWVLGLAVEPGSQVLHKLVFSLHHLLDGVWIYRAGYPLLKNL